MHYTAEAKIALWKSKKYLEIELSNLCKKEKELYEQINKVEDQLRIANSITHVIKGVPIHIRLAKGVDCYQCQVAAPDRSAWAEVYLNAHNKRTYGVRVKKNNDPTDKFLGANHTLKAALKLAKDFVINNSKGN